MKTGDHKILAGLILASIHINLFHVMLLPLFLENPDI